MAPPVPSFMVPPTMTPVHPFTVPPMLPVMAPPMFPAMTPLIPASMSASFGTYDCKPLVSTPDDYLVVPTEDTLETPGLGVSMRETPHAEPGEISGNSIVHYPPPESPLPSAVSRPAFTIADAEDCLLGNINIIIIIFNHSRN